MQTIVRLADDAIHTLEAEAGNLAYSNIGINKIDAMLKQPNCPFVLYVGSKKLVKRKEFEAYISSKLII